MFALSFKGPRSNPSRKPVKPRANSTRRPHQMLRWLRFEPLEDRRLLSVIAWDTADDPNGGDWDTASNWVGGQVPGPSDAVQIGTLNPGASVTHASAVADSVYSLTSQCADCGFRRLSRLANWSLINNTLVVSGGTLSRRRRPDC